MGNTKASHRGASWDPLVHPFWWAALALWVLNDQVLKGARDLLGYRVVGSRAWTSLIALRQQASFDVEYLPAPGLDPIPGETQRYVSYALLLCVGGSLAAR